MSSSHPQDRSPELVDIVEAVDPMNGAAFRRTQQCPHAAPSGDSDRKETIQAASGLRPAASAPVVPHSFASAEVRRWS